ncbi:MAG TPA: GNAT family N-acetyltransferase [Hanamia sp.]|nr:GNAT family N-acetyltransferase [Hanamia sp.]
MVTLVDYDVHFLEKSWKWLNDPEIKSLTLTPDFTKEDQIKFYNSLPARANYWIKGITEDNIPIGLVGLKNINTSQKSAEYWGFIGEKKFWGKGIGKFMIEEALKKARELNLKRVYLNVGSKNDRARNLYQKMNFRKVSKGEIEQYDIEL